MPALKKLRAGGYALIIISNQAGVAKGLFSQETLDQITANMLKEFAARQIEICGIYYCTHSSEDNCSCRKPKTGLIDWALSDCKKNGRDIELKDSYLIGDTIRDVETGKCAGLKTILVFSGRENPQNKGFWKVLPDFTAVDLSEAVDIIERCA